MKNINFRKLRNEGVQSLYYLAPFNHTLHEMTIEDVIFFCSDGDINTIKEFETCYSVNVVGVTFISDDFGKKKIDLDGDD